MFASDNNNSNDIDNRTIFLYFHHPRYYDFVLGCFEPTNNQQYHDTIGI
jgi:hypothetical protein